MATPPNAVSGGMTPPPGTDADSATPTTVPTSPLGASPAPATPAPGLQQISSTIAGAVKALNALAKAYPATSVHIQRANDNIREALAAAMESAQQGEPQAPPIGG